MSQRRVGIWLIGALGGVGATAALGLAALRDRLVPPIGLTTALPHFDHLDLDGFESIVVGGHDVRRTSFAETIRHFQTGSNIFHADWVSRCADQLAEWASHVRPGTVLGSGEAITQMAQAGACLTATTAREALDLIQRDLVEFKDRHRLEQVVVINVASTEPPPLLLGEIHQRLPALRQALDQADGGVALPASSVYALAALDLGWPYVNFTPSLGASFPAALEWAHERGALVAGQDGKTGETLLKSVLAPMFAARNLRLLSWVGHNIFGNRDGLILNDPRNKEAKIRTKDQTIPAIVGYQPQTHVSIEYIESLDDWKTAWDHIHFEGFLGVKMAMQFTWQGCDSILAGPLVLDLARLALLAQRRGESGVMTHLACYFKSPLGVTDQDFFGQLARLEAYVAER